MSDYFDALEQHLLAAASGDAPRRARLRSFRGPGIAAAAAAAIVAAALLLAPADRSASAGGADERPAPAGRPDVRPAPAGHGGWTRYAPLPAARCGFSPPVRAPGLAPQRRPAHPLPRPPRGLRFIPPDGRPRHAIRAIPAPACPAGPRLPAP